MNILPLLAVISFGICNITAGQFEHEKIGYELLNVKKRTAYRNQYRFFRKNYRRYLISEYVPALHNLHTVNLSIHIINGTDNTNRVPSSVIKEADIEKTSIYEYIKKEITAIGIIISPQNTNSSNKNATLLVKVKMAMTPKKHIVTYIYIELSKPTTIRKTASKRVIVWSYGMYSDEPLKYVFKLPSSGGTRLGVYLSDFISYYVSSNPKLIPKYTYIAPLK